MSATPSFDSFAEEVARAFALRGQLRRRIRADVRKRLLALAAEERERGAPKPEAEKRALERLGPPERLADEYRDRMLPVRITMAAQALLAGFIVLTLGLVVIGWRVVEARHYRDDGQGMVPMPGGWQTNADIYRHYPALGLWVPSGPLAPPFAACVLTTVVALIAAELATGLARRRARAAYVLVSIAAVSLVCAAAAEIDFAIRWRHAGQGHGALLAVIVAVGIVAVLCVISLAGALVSPLLPAGIGLLARPRMSLLVTAAPLAAAGIWFGLGIPHTCGWPGVCVFPPDSFYSGNADVTVTLPEGPQGAQAALALDGRTLAVALTVNRTQPPVEAFKPPGGPLELTVWRTSWSPAREGPCGRTRRADPINRLAPHRNTSCDLRDPASHPGVPWRRLVRIALDEPGPLALTNIGDGRPALAFYRRGAVWIAEAPGWRARRLFTARVEALRIAPLGNRDLLIAAVTGGKGGRRVVLVRAGKARIVPAPLAKARGTTLTLVSAGGKVALLYRDERAHLQLELRTPALQLLYRRDLGRWTQGAIGRLSGDRIGVAVFEPRGGAQIRTYPGEPNRFVAARVKIFVAGRHHLAKLVERELDHKSEIYCSSLGGIVQTGKAIVALGSCSGRTPFQAPIATDLSGWPMAGSVVEDWPRYAYLEASEASSPGNSWKLFDLRLYQPPELQLQGT